MDKINIVQDMMILKFVAPYDKLLNGKGAFWDEDNNEMYSSDRYLALREFNKQGYRVLQFVPNRCEGGNSEWVLVEHFKEYANAHCPNCGNAKLDYNFIEERDGSIHKVIDCPKCKNRIYYED